MSKIVKHNEFKKVVDALWDKVKDNFMTITKSSQYVSKFKPNVISEKTVIVDGYIQGNKSSSVDNNPNQVNYMGTGGFFIYDGLGVRTDTKISHIVIGVNENLNVGDMVSDVKIGYAKQTTFPNVIIDKYVIENGISFVHENKDTNLTNCTKAITVEVNDTVTDDVLLIVGCEGAIWGEKDASTTGLAAGGAPAPLVGETRPLGYGNWVGKVAIYADGISLKDMSNNITTNSSEIQNIENSKVDRTEVGNGVGQIPRIENDGRLHTSIMPNLAITDVHTVPNEASLMTQTVQKGDVVVVENLGNKVFMCKDENGQTQQDKFIEINMGYPVVKKVNNVLPSNTGELSINGTQINVDGQLPGTTIKDALDKCVKSVNGETPRPDGSVTIYARQISGTYNNNAGNIQAHLNTIKSEINGNSNRILSLERKHSTRVVGEFMACYGKGDTFTTKEGAVFLHLNGRLIRHTDYPDLAPALGIAGTVNAYNLPRINDITDNFDNNTKRAVRKHYVCAKA